MEGREPFSWSEVRERGRQWGREQLLVYVQDAMVWDPLGPTGRERSPSWSTFGRGYIVSPRTKGPLGTTEKPFNSRGQRSAQAADNLFAAFCYASS